MKCARLNGFPQKVHSISLTRCDTDTTKSKYSKQNIELTGVKDVQMFVGVVRNITRIHHIRSL